MEEDFFCTAMSVAAVLMESVCLENSPMLAPALQLTLEFGSVIAQNRVQETEIGQPAVPQSCSIRTRVAARLRTVGVDMDEHTAHWNLCLTNANTSR